MILKQIKLKSSSSIEDKVIKIFLYDSIETIKNRIASKLNTLPEYLLWIDFLPKNLFEIKEEEIIIKVDNLLSIDFLSKRNIDFDKLLNEKIKKHIDTKNLFLPQLFDDIFFSSMELQNVYENETSRRFFDSILEGYKNYMINNVVKNNFEELKKIFDYTFINEDYNLDYEYLVNEINLVSLSPKEEKNKSESEIFNLKTRNYFTSENENTIEDKLNLVIETISNYKTNDLVTKKKYLLQRIQENKEKDEEIVDFWNLNYEILDETNFLDFISGLKTKKKTPIKYNKSLLDLFNSCFVLEDLPIIKFNDFFKIYKDYIPSRDFLVEDNKKTINTIIFYTKEQSLKYNEEDDDDDVSNIYIDKDFYLYFDNTDENALKLLTKQEFWNFVEKEKVEEYNFKGDIFFQNTEINFDIFSFLIFSHPLYQQYLFIDETMKLRNSVYANRLHVTFYVNNEQFSIFLYNEERIVDLIEQKNLKCSFKKCKNQAFLNFFIEIFKKLLNIYLEKKNEIASFITIDKEEEKKKKEKFDVNYIDYKKFDFLKKRFTSLYTKKCQGPLIPVVILNDDFEDEMLQKGHEILYYPLNYEEFGLNQPFRFVSLDEKNKILYMKDSKYPCAGSKQSEKKIKKGEDEFGGKFIVINNLESRIRSRPNYDGVKRKREEMEQTSQQQYRIVTNNLLKNNQIGDLPLLLQNFFFKLNLPMYRFGVATDFENKVLECVDRAINDKEITNETIKNLRQDIERNFLLYNNQELFSLTNKNSLPTYFDPYYYLHTLEQKYQINILMFERTPENQISFFLPNCFQNQYYKELIYPNFILLYLHRGGSNESKENKLNHCEIIFQEISLVEKKMIFSLEDNLIQVLLKYFKLSKNIIFYEFTKNLTRINIISQKLDKYGRVCFLNLKLLDSETFTAITNKLQSIEKVKIEKDDEFQVLYVKTKEHLQNIIIKLNIKDIYSIVCDDILEIHGKLSEYVQIILLYKPSSHQQTRFTDIISFKSKNNETSFLSNNIFQNEKDNNNYIEKYYLVKKNAFITYEYIKWFFSYYILEEKNERDVTYIQEELMNLINEFFTNKVTIQETFDYSKKIIPYQTFTFDDNPFFISSSFFSGGRRKFIVKSEITKKQLKNKLIQDIMRKPKTILQYYVKNKEIKNFYFNENDFEKKDNLTIIKGKEKLNEYISLKENNIVLEKKFYNALQNKEEEYYFYNPIFDEFTFYLVQKVDTIENGIFLLKKWFEERINYRNRLHEKPDNFLISNFNYTIYFTYEKKLLLQNIENKKTNVYNMKLFKLKEEEDRTKFYYLCLLPL